MPFIVVRQAVPAPRAHHYTLIGNFHTKCILTSTIAVGQVEPREQDSNGNDVSWAVRQMGLAVRVRLGFAS